MTEPTAVYTTAKSKAQTYELTPAEMRIIQWIRNGASNGRDWMGTIRFVSGADVYQMSNHINAGQTNARN